MSDEQKHIEYLNLITKKLSSEITTDEDKRLQMWLSSDPENQSVFDSYLATWNEMDKVEGKTSKDLDLEWARLEETIEFEDEEKGAKERSLFPNVYRYAAAILILAVSVFIVYFFINIQGTEQLVAQKEIQEVKLAEGSIVTVNSNSTLLYPKKFQQDKREVELSGEAFFEVAKDPNRPFIIHADNIQVEVLGTSFNVKAYKGQGKIEVTVSSGKVAVFAIDNPDERVVLIKGEKAVFYKSSTKIEKSLNEDINFNSWKTREIIFEDTPMLEVIRIINEIYKSDLILKGDQLNDCPITVKFDDQSLESVLKVLQKTFDLRIEKKGNKVEVSGEGC